MENKIKNLINPLDLVEQEEKKIEEKNEAILRRSVEEEIRRKEKINKFLSENIEKDLYEKKLKKFMNKFNEKSQGKEEPERIGPTELDEGKIKQLIEYIKGMFKSKKEQESIRKGRWQKKREGVDETYL